MDKTQRPPFITVLDLAIAKALELVKEKQIQILVIKDNEKFGVPNAEFYKASNPTESQDIGLNVEQLSREWKSLLNLASKMECLRDSYFDRQYDEVMKDFFEKMKKDI